MPGIEELIMEVAVKTPMAAAAFYTFYKVMMKIIDVHASEREAWGKRIDDQTKTFEKSMRDIADAVRDSKRD